MEKQVSEGSLHKWFKGSKSKDGKPGWVNVVTGGTCASDKPGEGTPKCVSSVKRASMTKRERLSAARRKKKADPNQQQKSGAAKPTYVSTDKPKKKKMKETYERSLVPLTEKAKKCWPGYEKKGTKKMFGKTYNNCVKKEEVELEAYSANPAQQAAIAIAKKKKKEDDMVAKKMKKEEVELTEVKDKKGKGSGTKDACYHKVKSRYSVWPSAYASGALVKCRKVGAANWGNSTKKESFSDWKSEFIWEDGDSSKKLEEKKKLVGGKDPFKKNPRLVDQAFDKIDGLIPVKKIKKDLPTDVNEEMTELQKLQNAVKTGEYDGKKLSPKELEGIKAGLSQGGNKTEEFSNWRDELHEDDMKGMSVKSGHKRPTKSGAGMTKKGVEAYRRRNPGSKLQTAVTTKPSKLKKGSKAANRRKSYCARSAGQMKKFPKAAKDPNSRLRQARKRWNC
jgi:hypothetical protein